jgi:hypothetical protein
VIWAKRREFFMLLGQCGSFSASSHGLSGTDPLIISYSGVLAKDATSNAVWGHFSAFPGISSR